MKKLKHSKFKNTGLLFELLVRKIASETMNESDSTALRIINKHFRPKSEIVKELQLYRDLFDEKFQSSELAEKYINIVLDSRQALNENVLRKEKYNLIKDVSNAYDINEIFSARLNNYKLYASIYLLFEYSPADNPKQFVNTHNVLKEHICNNTKKRETTKALIESQDKDIRVLSMRILIDKFNDKFKNLSPRQKKTLKEYINSVSNSAKLTEHIKKESKILTKELKNRVVEIPSKVIKIKVNEVLKLLENFNNRKIVNDSDILTILKYQELVSELDKAKE